MSVYITPDPGAPTIAEIIEATALLTFVPRDSILSRRRHKEITDARKIVCALGRRHGYSYPRIAARLYANQDHSSVIYGARICLERAERDGEFAVLLEAVDRHARRLSDHRRAKVAASVPLALREAA